MIENELILLGLLNQSPKHGYEIKKNIKELLLLFEGVNLKSIYYPLEVLEKEGLVVKHIAKQGKWPKRFIYRLTPKGKIRFKELLTKSLLNFKRPQFSLDLSLYFLDNIKSQIAKRRLRARLQILKKLSASLEQTASSLKNKDSSSLIRILDHNLQMVDTESRFLSRLIATL